MHAIVLSLAGLASVVAGAPRRSVSHAPAAQAILKRVCQAHNGLKTYRAKVTLLTQANLQGTGKVVFESHSTLALDRGTPARGALRSMHGLSVCDGERFLRYQRHANAYTIESAPDSLPGYLFRLPYGRQVTQGDLTSLLLLPDLSARFEARRIGRFQVVPPNGQEAPTLVHLRSASTTATRDLWIDRASHLIRRHRLTFGTRAPSSRGVKILWAEESHSDVQADQPIPADVFAVAIPPGAKKVDRLPALPHLSVLVREQVQAKARPASKPSPSPGK